MPRRIYNIFNFKNNKLTTLVNSLMSLVFIVILILLIYFLKIPNPNLILFTGLIIVTSLFGFIPGAITLAGVYFYTLFFFSDYTFTEFTKQNSIKTVVSFITATICYLFVAFLNHYYRKEREEILNDNNKLKNVNEKLKAISSLDTLTATKNRYALRKDFGSLINEETYLLIFDIDNFKIINDTLGHQVGDEVLKKVAKSTKDVFTTESVYRYGGDEFIVIKKHVTLNQFKHDIDQLIKDINNIKVEGFNEEVHISVGYTFGMPNSQKDILSMIKESDNNLYKMKREGKNGVFGSRFIDE